MTILWIYVKYIIVLNSNAKKSCERFQTLFWAGVHEGLEQDHRLVFFPSFMTKSQILNENFCAYTYLCSNHVHPVVCTQKFLLQGVIAPLYTGMVRVSQHCSPKKSMAICTQSRIHLHKWVPMVKYCGPQK